MKLTTLEISWHGKEPIFSVDFSSHSKTTRLATCGADFNIRVRSSFLCLRRCEIIHCDDFKIRITGRFRYGPCVRSKKANQKWISELICHDIQRQ